MNQEQIKEIMRLGELWAQRAWNGGKGDEDEITKIVPMRANLEAYLRTIGEPENTFPLNPNGASKWAHLQKHDGAQAIGVVFRTGTGSVGSLVDGRVVWADWLAYPNGSKSADSEYTDEDMAAVGRALMSAITQYAPKGWSPADCPSEIVGDLHNECEELRSDAERYRKLRDVDAWGEDTAPDGGSAWARLGELHGSEFDAFVDSRAESAIETPAKVSPCAGHAVQQEADDLVGLRGCNSRHGVQRAEEAFPGNPLARRVEMTGAEIDCLVALVEKGPLWDGDVPSKRGRDSLIDNGLAVRAIVSGADGYTAATYAGRDAYKCHFGTALGGDAGTIDEAKANRQALRAIAKATETKQPKGE